MALSLLAFLGAAGVALVGAASAALCLAAGRRRLARRIAGGAAVAAALYLAALVGFSMTSRERTLPVGGRKYFCEIDCHLAYSIVSAEERTGRPPCGRAGDSLQIVHVETWFDPSTISSSRGNALLSPNPRRVFLVDPAGQRYEPLPGCRNTVGESVPFTRALRPGESYRTALVFNLPAGVRGLRLWLGEPTPGAEQFLAGHENSLFHRKVYFALP